MAPFSLPSESREDVTAAEAFGWIDVPSLESEIGINAVPTAPSDFGWSDYLGESGAFLNCNSVACWQKSPDVLAVDGYCQTVEPEKKKLSISDFSHLLEKPSDQDDSYPALTDASNCSDDSDYEYSRDFFASRATCDDDDDDRPAVERRRRVVTFDHVRIREYALCLGDHPWTDSYPLQLDWQYTNKDKVSSVNRFEASRHRRNQSEFPERLTARERRSRLEEITGLTPDELDELELYRLRLPCGDGMRSSLSHSSSYANIIMSDSDSGSWEE